MRFSICKRFVVFALLMVLCSSYKAAAQDQVHRVLFVGNSYTYFHSMPELFAAIVEHQMPGHLVETKFLGGGGATMQKHWEVGFVVEALKNEKWDYVVLQGQSMLGSDDLTHPDSPKQFYKYAKMIDEAIEANGAETVFFMTWSRKALKEQQVYLTNAYTTVSNELDATLAPVGTVWHTLRDHPELELYEEDGSHPSISGSYVAAMTLAATLFGILEEPAPGALYGQEILRGGALAEEKSQLSNLPAETVEIIQNAVAETFLSSVEND